MLSGWLILDKPRGISSSAATSVVRRLTSPRCRAGHGGSLDPLAQGVLPIALGEARKTVSCVLSGAKHYEARVRWGEERDSDDLEGVVVRRFSSRPRRSAIESALREMSGEVMQTPPSWSALRVGGVRAYRLSRRARSRGESPPAMRPRVRRASLRLSSVVSSDEALIDVECESGYYVRSMARDLGRRLGCGGTLSGLRRTRCGPFDVSRAISLDNVREMVHKGFDSSAVSSLDCFLPTESALSGFPRAEVSVEDARRLRDGAFVLCSRARSDSDSWVEAAVFCEGRLIALARRSEGYLRPRRGFRIEEL